MLELKDFEAWPGWDELCAKPTQSEGANQKKQQLLEMARNGEDRPSNAVHFVHPLNGTLSNYTNKNKNSYDDKFNTEIRELAPHWFDVTYKYKQQLLEIAKSGRSRPSIKHPLHRVLKYYTSKNKTKTGYDPEFTDEIKRLAPHWWTRKATEKKEQLLQMAKNGEPKPIALIRALYIYTNKNKSSYDDKFNTKIRELAPYWFDATYEKKQQLLEIAKSGKPKPHRKTKLGSALNSYIYGKSDEFSAEIKRLAPDWIGRNSPAQKKQQLLQIAKNGEPKPLFQTSLYNALHVYTGKNQDSYDPQFTAEIKKLAPHWLVSQFDIANQKKQQLLKMAKNDKPRPTQRKHPLGRSLTTYTRKKSKIYDPEFTKRIKELAPHWFKN